MSYDFRQGKKDVEDILNSKTPITESDEIPGEAEFTYDNSVRTWVGSIFVDIVDSTTLFKSNNISDDITARILRSFTEQIVLIMNDSENVYQIGIRGDCVYGIFRANYKERIVKMFRTAYCINTFLKLFNVLLKKRNLPQIKAGIGIGCNKDVVIKSGRKRIIHDNIWVGDAVVNASNLSGIANRSYNEPICMDDVTYHNIINILTEENPKYSNWIRKAYSPKYGGSFYECDIVQTDFNDWIDEEVA